MATPQPSPANISAPPPLAMPPPPLLRWLLLASLVAVAQAQPLASRADLAALYSLRSSLGLRARDWPLKADPCTRWSGVSCTAGRVVGVTVAGLRRTRVAAATPSQFSSLDALRNLTALATFNASGFALPGSVPSWFGSGLPAALAVLDLSDAGVTGALPRDLGASGSLTAVVLSGNNLSGNVPSALLAVKGLQLLDLSRNNLTGPLPTASVGSDAAAAAAANGSVFNVSGNSLYGGVAADAIAALRRRFEVVDVSGNYLDGAWNGSSGSDSNTTVLATANCFYGGVQGQRSRADCEEFYRKQGVELAAAPAPSPAPLLPQPPSPSSPEKKKQGVSRYVLIGVLVAAGALVSAVFVIALLLCFVRRRSRGTRSRGGRGVEASEEGARSGRRRDSSVNPVSSLPPVISPTPGANDGGGPPKDDASPAVSSAGEFTYDQLVLATGGFGDDKLIRRGHSGDIYHGVLENGSHVVVKKVGGGAKGVSSSSSRHAGGELEFYSRYSHERIVPLLAHVRNGEDGEEFMAYKYMPKGDLTHALHKKPAVDAADGLRSLDWITRLKIATGVAEAMCFLHDECSPPLVHRDIQSSSVLLDDKYDVRLGSMSEICVQQSGGSQNVFTRILRSSKSLDKHASGPPATCSYDVLCFGKVLLELVTGNFGISSSGSTTTNDAEASEEWLSNTLSLINNGGDRASISGIMDPLLLVDEDHLEEVWAVAVIAKTCLSAKPSRRPSARYVLRALHNPLRVVRRQGSSSSRRSGSGSARKEQLKSSSSRSSWQSVFQANHRVQSLDAAAAAAVALDRRHSLRSHGSAGEASFSFKRAVVTDAVQEPVPEAAVLDEDTVVV